MKKTTKQSHPRLREALGLIPKCKPTEALKLVIWELMHTQTELKNLKEKIMSKEARAKEAIKHKDVLGAGAKKRKSLPAKEKVGVVMKEFKRGTLHSGSGEKVSNPKQAIAIGLSEARKAGAKIPKKRK